MNKNKKTNIFILAGEPSGDMHGANLMNHIKQEEQNVCFFGIGGKHMLSSGLTSVFPIKQLSVMGFWEVLKKLLFFISLEKKVLTFICNNSIDKIILIDYPGFNLRIAEKIKRKTKIPIIFYISPQLWAWKESRIIKIKSFIDYLIVLFPFEVSWYKKRGVLVHFFGHPVIENWESFNQHTKKGIAQKKITIGLFPGSRKQEIVKHLPVLLSVVKKHSKINSQVKFVISKVPSVSDRLFKQFKLLDVSVVESSSFSLLQKSDLAIVSSGTATLECAVSKTPFITVYKMSFLSWIITKHFISQRFVSIVNILLNGPVVPELIQKNMNPKNIIKHINQLLDGLERQKQIDKFKELEKLLKRKNAYLETARFITKI